MSKLEPMTDVRQLILHCTEVNRNYMRLPAGHLKKYQQIANIYDRLAVQSWNCAEAWVKHVECPDHEPAVDAFWWSVVSWAESFGSSLYCEPEEWGEIFVMPHLTFAEYLKPNGGQPYIEEYHGSPGDIIMELDVRWMKSLMKLTAQWGLFAHLKDMGALREAQLLESELKGDNEVRTAYLRSDLVFFDRLFAPFPFTEETRQVLNEFINKAREEINGNGR